MTPAPGEILLGLAVAAAIGAIVLALGERVRASLRLAVPPGARPAAAFTLGSWALGLAVLAVGLAGMLRPAVLLALAAAAAAAGRWRSWPVLARRLRAPAVAALPLVPVALAPPFFYDSWVYHLGLPWQALQDRALLAHPGNLFSSFPPLAQLIYAVPLAAGAHRAAAAIHLLGCVAAAGAIAALARRLGAPRLAAWLAGAATLYLPTAPLVPAFPAAEGWAGAAIAVGVVLALTGRSRGRAAAGAGLAAGVACAARLQGLPWAGLVGALLALRARPPLRALAAFGLGALAGAAPWWIKNGLLLGDPLAPLGWDRAGIETLWRDSSSHLNLAAGAADLVRRVFDALVGTGPLVLPLLAAGLVGFLIERRRARLLLAGAAAGGWVAWALTGALGRFLAPSFALLVAGTAALGRRGARRACALLLVGTVVAWGGWRAAALARHVGGWRILGDAAAVYASAVVSDPSPAFRACARLEPDARLLLVGEPRGFLLPRAFETTSQHDPTPLAGVLERHADAEAATAELRRAGYSHVLINLPEMRRLAAHYPVLPWNGPTAQQRFAAWTRTLGAPVVLERGVVVYALARAR